MRKIFESDYYTTAENVESSYAVSVWQIEDEKEEEFLTKASSDELQAYTGLWSEYNVEAGELFHRYTFDVLSPYVFIRDRIARNV